MRTRDGLRRSFARNGEPSQALPPRPIRVPRARCPGRPRSCSPPASPCRSGFGGPPSGPSRTAFPPCARRRPPCVRSDARSSPSFRRALFVRCRKKVSLPKLARRRPGHRGECLEEGRRVASRWSLRQFWEQSATFPVLRGSCSGLSSGVQTLGCPLDAGSARNVGRLTLEWVERCQERKRLMLRKTDFDNVPIKPQRVYQEMNEVFKRDTIYVSTIGLSQIAGGQFLHV